MYEVQYEALGQFSGYLFLSKVIGCIAYVFLD